MNALAQRISVGALICGLLALGNVGIASAQIPDKFTNLKVLPKDISKGELVGMMREFSGALGQRCKFCHVGESTNSLEGYDFASDEPRNKQTARVMMKMVQEINANLLPKSEHEGQHRVACVTCHRGVKEPETMETILREAIEAGGVEAAVARYRELRQEYYGKGSYDFSTGPMRSVAESLVRENNDLDEAIALMKANLEFNPDESLGHLMLGQLYLQKGEKDAAMKSVERALELEPDNRWAKRMLERMKSN